MQPLGRILKHKRESLGMTLNDLEQKIKIQRKYLEMIERNEFDSLPNPVYARGFIEKYAKSVNVNADALLKDHYEELPAVSASARNARQKLKIDETKLTQQEDRTIRPLLLVILSTLIAVTVVWLLMSQLFYRSTERSWMAEDINESRNVTVKTAPDTKKKDTSKEQVKKTVDSTSIKYRSFDGTTLSYDVVTTTPLTVKLSSNDATWIQVYDDKNKRYAYEEVKSKTMKINEDAKELTIISGNSTGLTMTMNGEKIDVPKSAENVITRTYQFSIEQTKK